MPLIELNGYIINTDHIDFIRPVRVNLSDEGCEISFQGGGTLSFGRQIRVITTQIRERTANVLAAAAKEKAAALASAAKEKEKAEKAAK
jgi:hypothetical protein